MTTETPKIKKGAKGTRPKSLRIMYAKSQPRTNARALRPVCTLDFDGTVNSYVSGWEDYGKIPDPPIDGAKEALIELRKHYNVYIFSSRCNAVAGRNAMWRWLKKHGLVVDGITNTKPSATIGADDRVVAFYGNWEQTLEELSCFVSHLKAKDAGGRPTGPALVSRCTSALSALRSLELDVWATDIDTGSLEQNYKDLAVDLLEAQQQLERALRHFKNAAGEAGA